MPMATRAMWVCACLGALAGPGLGCDASKKGDGSSPSTDAPAAVAEPRGPGATAKRVEIVAAPAGDDAAALVRAELERARSDGRDLVVYVGATWCEPCTRFHEAAAAGQLDRTFPGLRLLEFDHDRDEPRLQAAGYTSRMIPLFALPGADGRASGKQIEGSVKGEAAVGEISPRLAALLARR
jgi:hypothetical protein